MKSVFIYTFGTAQLKDFDVQPTETLLLVDGSTEGWARKKVQETKGIGLNFCTSYPLDRLPDLITKWGNPKLLTLFELNKKRIR